MIPKGPAVLIVSDVHGAFAELAELAAGGDTLLVLGDLINLMDYRTGEGIIADVLGLEFARESAALRAAGDYPAMRELWRSRVGDRFTEIRAEIDRGAGREYESCRTALEGGHGFVTYGNVDRPELLAASLPSGFRFVDGCFDLVVFFNRLVFLGLRGFWQGHDQVFLFRLVDLAAEVNEPLIVLGIYLLDGHIEFAMYLDFVVVFPGHL